MNGSASEPAVNNDDPNKVRRVREKTAQLQSFKDFKQMQRSKGNL